jgi:U3 small nucleolar ribonucleoprotein protein IMP4
LILLTTSRRPTKGIRTFCKDLSHTLPNVLRINRGKLSLEGVAAKAIELGAEKVVIVDRWKGGPGKIELYRVNGRLQPIPPLIYLRGVKLRREFQTMPRGKRIKSVAIAASPKPSQEVSRLEKAFSDFFGIPIISREDEYGCYNALMLIATNPVGEIVTTFRLLPENLEIGPRMRISHLIWDLTVHEG